FFPAGPGSAGGRTIDPARPYAPQPYLCQISSAFNLNLGSSCRSRLIRYEWASLLVSSNRRSSTARYRASQSALNLTGQFRQVLAVRFTLRETASHGWPTARISAAVARRVLMFVLMMGFSSRATGAGSG